MLKTDWKMFYDGKRPKVLRYVGENILWAIPLNFLTLYLIQDPRWHQGGDEMHPAQAKQR